MKPCRVLLVDDHTLVRGAFQALLAQFQGVEVVGEAGNGHDAIRQIAALRPDVVLMDVMMPGLDGIEVTQRVMRSKLPHPPRILMVTMHASRDCVRRALVAGAVGYLLKDADQAELELAIAAVARGQVWISAGVARFFVDELVDGGSGSNVECPTSDLTPRQREILGLIADGASTRDVAVHFGISVKTVESHRAQIMNRLGIDNLAGLVRYAIRTGMVSAGP